MSNIKNLRQSLGITQQQLAGYLSVSRAELSLAETGRRVLPTAAQLKLSAMQRHMTGGSSPGTTIEIQRQTAQAQNMLRAQAQKCNRLAAAAIRRLELMRGRYQQCQKILKAVHGLLGELPAGPAGRKQKLSLEVLQSDTRKKMDACGIGAQVILELQVNMFLYHAKQAAARMA